MIKVIMFDLGATLVETSTLRPFPHVEEALTQISGFTTQDGSPLRSCLVSDYEQETPPQTEAEIAALFREYCAKLDETGLRHFFDPVERRVTLSIQAGKPKPSRAIFELALRRLGADVPLQDCLLITENRGHIDAARTELDMAALQFRDGRSARFDFDDWSQAPASIASLMANS